MSPTAKSRLQSSLSSAAHAAANAPLSFPRLSASGKRPCDTGSNVVFMILIFFGNFLFCFFPSFSPSLFFYAVFTSLGIPFKHLTLPPRLFAVGDVRVVGELWLRSTFCRKPGCFASVLFCGMH